MTLHPRGTLRAKFATIATGDAAPPWRATDDVFRRLGVGARKCDLGDEGLYLAEELVEADQWLGGSDPETLAILVLALMIALVLGSAAYFVGRKFAEARLTVANSLSGGWIAFSPERVQSELAQGRTVFVDFTAAWCLTCKFNEASVLESAAVKDAFDHYGIVKMKADWTNADPVITKSLKQFGRVGVPLYVLYPAGASNQPIVLPELLTQGIVLEHLETAAPKVAASK